VKRYEYKVERLQGSFSVPFVETATDELNGYGAEGWRLVAADGDGFVYLIREVDPDEATPDADRVA
jgi:uncharacterized protein (AIM24 family)